MKTITNSYGHKMFVTETVKGKGRITNFSDYGYKGKYTFMIEVELPGPFRVMNDVMSIINMMENEIEFIIKGKIKGAKNVNPKDVLPGNYGSCKKVQDKVK